MARRPRLVEIGKPIVDGTSEINHLSNEYEELENEFHQNSHSHESLSSLMRMSNQTQQASRYFAGKRKGKVKSKIIIGEAKSPAIHTSSKLTTENVPELHKSSHINDYSSIHGHHQTNGSIFDQYTSNSHDHSNSCRMMIQSKNFDSLNGNPNMQNGLNQMNMSCNHAPTFNSISIEKNDYFNENCNNNDDDSNSMNMEVEEISSMEVNNIETNTTQNKFYYSDYNHNNNYLPSEIIHSNGHYNDTYNAINSTKNPSMNHHNFHQTSNPIDSALVVLDGANIAHAYGQAISEEEPNVRGIALAVDFFLNFEGVHVQVVLPSYWCRKKNNFLPKGENAMMQTESLDLLQSMKAKGLLCLTPPTDDDDAYMIAIATTTTDSDAYIVSNDLFRDAIYRDERQQRKKSAQNQLQNHSLKNLHNHSSLNNHSFNDKHSIHYPRQNLRDWFQNGGRISYSFCNVGFHIDANSTTNHTNIGYNGDRGGTQMKFIPNPRHQLIEKIQIL